MRPYSLVHHSRIACNAPSAISSSKLSIMASSCLETRHDAFRLPPSFSLSMSKSIQSRTMVSGGPSTVHIDSTPGNSHSIGSEIQLLEQQTQKELEQAPKVDEHLVTQLMKEWLSVDDANKYDQNNTAHSIDQLFQHWLKQYSINVPPKTVLPFCLTMEAWRRIGKGEKCAFVLDKWGEVLGGDLTLAPTLDAFHVVMEAYSKNPSLRTISMILVTQLLHH